MKLIRFGILFGVLLTTAIDLVRAQQIPEEELLERAVVAPYQSQPYKELNALPEDIRKQKPFARYLHRFMKYAGAEGVIDAEARYLSFQQSQKQIEREAYKISNGGNTPFADAWVNVGPTNSGGCTKALAVHPIDPNIVFAGAAGGGVWKTTNGGSSWAPLTDLVIPDLAVVSIAIDPSSPSTIFAGSGDGSVANNGLAGTGLYRSTNGGASWARVASTTLARTVNKVLVHPSNSDIVFACNYDGTGTNGKGLYRSTDGGNTFKRVYPATKNADGIIWDVVAGATISGKTIFYLVQGNNPGGSSTECGIYKSIDDGATWGKLNTTTLPAGSSIGKAALAVPKANQNKVFCFMANPSGNVQGLYRSTDGGSSFSSISVPNSIFAPTGSGAQGWYDLCLGVSPGSNTSDTILIGGVEAYRSFNGGSSWTAYSDYGNNSAIHVDHHAITFDPSNSRRVYIGTDGGIYKSTNTGQTWSYINNNYHTMRFYHLGLDKSDFKRTLAGAQDQGTWQTYSGQSPQARFGGDGFNAIIDPTNSSTYYVEGPFGELYRITNNTNVSNITGSNFESQSNWDTPFIMAPKSSSTLFTGRTQVWRSVNQGNTWSSISPTFGNPYINTLAVSPANANVIYAGLYSGKIKRTTNGGTDWTDKNISTTSSIASIVCHPRDEDWALASINAASTSTPRVLVTTNGGSTWTNASGSGSSALPGVAVNQVALDSTDPANIWYAATDNGIYYTLDGGKNWSVAGSGLGLAPCWDVQVHANKITIRVATHGRSIWEANANILPVELSSLIAERTMTGTRLHWTTDTERDNSGFWVQRSYNYAPFEDIEFVQGAGNSSIRRNYSFFDTKTDPGYYIYRLKQVDLDGSEHLSNIVEVRYGDAGRLRLDQSYPNPFFVGSSTHSKTKIRFALESSDRISMKIYTIDGRAVRTLLDRAETPQGEQVIEWDGKDDTGAPVESGTYIYGLELSNGQQVWNKLAVIKQ